MNASTFSARVTIATLSDMYIGRSTSRHRHAQRPFARRREREGVIKMLQEIGSLDKVDAYIAESLEQRKNLWASATAFTGQRSIRARRI